MGFFQKLRAGLIRFMYGRNGIDQLGVAVVWGCLILDILDHVPLRPVPLLGICLGWASMAVWVYALFRVFSKNLNKRRAENQRWLNWWWKVKSSRSSAKARHADKEHKYFTCKNCGAICRVPAGKGKIIITCPKCGAQIQGRS